MNIASIPISTLFVGLNGLVAFALSYIVVAERAKTRIWHGESKEDVVKQPNPLINPNIVAATVENFIQKNRLDKDIDEGVLQRKVRAYGNFVEYVPLALLFLLALELMRSPSWLVWLLGGCLTIGRLFYAWGVITTYGPSPGRAIGFFLTWFVYIVGSAACIYYGLLGTL